MERIPRQIMAALEGIGLNDAEVAVYHSLLGLGPRPASTIAQKAGLKRSNTYAILSELKEKGIVQEIIKNNVRHFSCSPPRSLLSVVQNQVDQLELNKRKLESIMPVLEGIRNTGSKTASARFFQGKEGVKEIFEDILREPYHDIYALVDLEHSWSSADEDMREWVKGFIAKREERNIWWRAIAVKSNLSDKELSWRSSKKREIKMLEGFHVPAEVNVYGNKVALTSTGTEMFGVVIDNEAIAETLRSFHKALWSFLPDYALLPKV